jgi:D-arabinose 1-dehydrogenase-like Zn-dependent alcohol dehydrogenase
MTTISNSVYRGVEGTVKKVSAELPAALGPKEILMKITHASLCGTDVHYIPYGAALGHEGVGIVEKIGSAVTQFKVGDRAGAGYLRNVSRMSRVIESADWGTELRTLHILPERSGHLLL